MTGRALNGVLLLYRCPLAQDAATVMEHVLAFPGHSQFNVWPVNTELGYPPALAGMRFSMIVLHYSIFGKYPFYFPRAFQEYLHGCAGSFKVAFFQDEYADCQERFAFINDYKLDCIYTLVEEDYFDLTYRRYTGVQQIQYTIPGYVSEALRQAARQHSLPDGERRIDIGYRGRDLSQYYALGQGAREKTEIAAGFLEHAKNLGLALDIETAENKRIYGPAWHTFLANCRAVLGVEAGVSIFDLEGEAARAVASLKAANPHLTFQEAEREALYHWEGNIPYRTISPRHFEAAAFRVCQILFEGQYSGILQADRHYLALKKDFSNFDAVIREFRKAEVRRELAENAYQDLIASGQYDYRQFIDGLDRLLIRQGIRPGIDPDEARQVSQALAQLSLRRSAYNRLKYLKERYGRSGVGLLLVRALTPLQRRTVRRAG